MSLRSIRQSCVERAESLSPAGAAAVLLSFLLGYYYWANLVRIDFATLLFELLFLG
ncbi:hypothetical protein ACLE20_03110 [Rhizobium sp. YIM 134829]|uniref:hypothetical protein n=1 Tax=Rhizobium sp. YIM 134829 TaxID=3390453 RepID=UPI00397C5F17